MPRTGRGGMRQGLPGKAYGQRTDLNQGMPVAVAKNQEYGRASEQQAAQRAIPVASTPVVSAPALSAPTQTASAPQSAPQTLSSQLQPPQTYPGDLPFLHPTQYPNEPTTAGIASGPGAGPEALVNAPVSLTDTLQGMARNPNAPARLMDLANAAQVLGL